MRRPWPWILLIVLLVPGGASADAWAQLALFDPVQIVGSDRSVSGLRLNLLLGANEHMQGIDLGLANRTYGNEKGFQLGLYNEVAGHCHGLQMAAALSDVGGALRGAQLSVLAARTARGVGLQSSLFYSSAVRLIGLQIGLVNVAEESATLQLGLFNWNEAGFLPFFPGFNFAIGSSDPPPDATPDPLPEPLPYLTPDPPPDPLLDPPPATSGD